MNPTGLDLPPLLAAFVFGLMGGAHCIGMCGGIMSALTFAVPPSMRHPARMGGLLQIFAALMLILMALYIANWWKGLLKVEAVGRRLWRFIEPVGRRLMPVVHLPQAFALGALWGWLPCGLVYSMLAWSLAIADPLQGALLMGAFGLGTLPALLATGLAARQLSHLIRHPATRSVAAITIIAFALWQLWTVTAHNLH